MRSSSIADSRYHRQTLVPGWNQRTLTAARVMVVGAGALGCELLKNLALSGIGHVTIVDFDAVELSNLSRCVLYRDSDLGRNKAIAAAERLRDLNPHISTTALARNIEHDLGAGALRGYDLVLGAVDTIAGRLGIDRLCRQAGLPWIDGGMDATGGQVSLFNAANGPCYQCAMTESMWARVAQRHGCLALGAGIEQPTVRLAATITMASSIGAIQAQEAIRYLLRKGKDAAPAMQPGERICLQTAPYAMYTLQSKKNPECECAVAAERPSGMESELVRAARVPFITASKAADLLTATDAESLMVPWDIVTALECFGCSHERTATPLFRLRAAHLPCAACGRTRTPEMQSRIQRTDRLAQHTLAQLGFPPQSHIELTRSNGETFTIELAEQALVEHNAPTSTPAEVHA